ncbi:MAG: hypothetical protein IID46_07130 [Planctomycetes bacterium]|nr:hypothetical protein [Planctomycetota bacterium]
MKIRLEITDFKYKVNENGLGRNSFDFGYNIFIDDALMENFSYHFYVSFKDLYPVRNSLALAK